MKQNRLLTFSEFTQRNRAFEEVAEKSVAIDKERIKNAFYQKLKDVRQRLMASKKKSTR